MKYKIEVMAHYEVETDNEEEVFDKLQEQFDKENTTVENEFWANANVTEIKSVGGKTQ